jgi:hypothetical protein
MFNKMMETDGVHGHHLIIQLLSNNNMNPNL